MRRSPWRFIRTILGIEKKLAHRSFSDPALGEFTFVPGIGWNGFIDLDGSSVRVVLGSDGAPPSKTMVETIVMIRDTWKSCLDAIHVFIQGKFDSREWANEPHLPAASELQPRSLQVLWENDPKTCFIEFENPGDERVWHVTLEALQPKLFGFDH